VRGIRTKLILISTSVVVPASLAVYAWVRSQVHHLGLEPRAVQDVLSFLDRSALVTLFLAIAASVSMSTVAAGIASRTARALAASARQMADGDVRTLGVAHAEDEFGELGQALDLLARSYSAAVADFRRERDRVSGILTGMREGVLLLDRRRRVALVNPALREMLLLGADVEGRSPLEVIRHGELIRLLDEADARDGPAAGEIDLGGLKPRRLLVQVVRIPGETGGLLAVFVDVTHLRRLEALRRDFVANASHELRTPVASINSAAETLETAINRDPAAAHEFVAIIVRNADRLKNLVDDLLDLSRIESQDFKVHLEALSVADVGDAVLDLFRERASKKGVTLVSAAPKQAAVLVDRRGLEHVLTNLVDNAVKYCGPGSTVTLRTEPGAAENTLRVVIEDDGPGVAKEHLPRLFERFYRVDPGRSRQMGGTGLGLSIVKHLVEAMGGRIEVDSTLGEGTTFTVTLPATVHVVLPLRVTNAPPPPV
jgi:two-component system phosphate regulon sensor histidine kinase PhoR